MIISQSGASLATTVAGLFAAGAVAMSDTAAVAGKFGAHGRSDCKGEGKCKGNNGCKTVTLGRGFVAL